jgi:hypothetical protein
MNDEPAILFQRGDPVLDVSSGVAVGALVGDAYDSAKKGRAHLGYQFLFAVSSSPKRSPKMRIKLSIVITDLLGVSGLRILQALAAGETDARNLTLLGDGRLRCTEEQLVEALAGRSHPLHRQMLALQLERLGLLDEQIAKLNNLMAQAMRPHQDAVIRLAEVPGLGIDSAQQIIAEVGVTASSFSSAAEFSSWVGTCPGKELPPSQIFQMSSKSASAGDLTPKFVQFGV